ncbi:MAG: DUF1080 domain-containing protein [Verrucomicrobiota bacterium]
MKDISSTFIILCLMHKTAAFLILTLSSLSADEQGGWKTLLNPELSHWDIFMGVPHTSVEGLPEGTPQFEDVRKGTPIGLNKDPKNVFQMQKEGDEDLLYITGEIYAGIVTKESFENYHLSLQFKWGEKRWKPRLNAKRNSGLLYHSVGDYTDFWKVWMTCLECEIMEGDTGDFIGLGRVRADIPVELIGEKYHFKPGAWPMIIAYEKGIQVGRAWKSVDTEKPNGEWNTVEIYCLGNTNIHLVNGTVNMVVLDPTVNQGKGWQPLTSGKIQLQSEGAELWYKDIKIRPITEIPDTIKSGAGL